MEGIISSKSQVSFPGLTNGDSAKLSRGNLCRYPESCFCAACSPLGLSHENSSHLGLSRFSVHLFSSGVFQESYPVSPPLHHDLEIQGSQWNHLIHFPLLRDHSLSLSDIQCLENHLAKIFCLVFDWFHLLKDSTPSWPEIIYIQFKSIKKYHILFKDTNK